MNPKGVPAHLSFSTLMMWERCPHQYLLSKVAEAPQKPAVYFAGGTAVHLMTEALDTGQAPPGAKFEDYFYPEVERLMEAHDGLYWDTKKWLAGADSLDDWLTIGPQCVDNWRKLGEPGDYVEEDITGSLPGCPVPIKAFADRITGKRIRDIKSGKSKPKNAFQLDTYMALYGVLTGDPEGLEGEYFMAREGRSTPPRKASLTPSEVGERYSKAYAEMIEAAETGEYPYKREFTCKWCPQQDSCMAYVGTTKQAKQNDPYWEQGRPGF